MEVLQCIKCAMRHDLLFREPAPSSILEVEESSDELDDVGEPEEESDVEEFSWDGLLIEDEDEEAIYYSD